MQVKYYGSSPVNQPRVKNVFAVFAVDEEHKVFGVGGSEEDALNDLLRVYAESKSH